MYWLVAWLVGTVTLALVGVALWRRAGVRARSRGIANAIVGVVWLAASGAVVVPLALEAGTSGEARQGWVLAAVAVGWFTTVLLAARAVAGDPSHGRRRCPKCWYDMSATPGLVCSECGHDGRRESRLFRTRRSRWFMRASLAPLAAGLALGVVWFEDRDRWLRSMPTWMLVGASPWYDWGDTMGIHLLHRSTAQRQNPMSWWERALTGRVSRGVTRSNGDPMRSLLHASILLNLQEDDETTATALIRLGASPDASVARSATEYLGRLRATEEVEHALERLTEHADAAVVESAVRSLARIKRERPGGAPPAAVLAATENGTDEQRVIACRALGLYDPDDRSRANLLIAGASEDGRIRAAATASLANLYPGDDAALGLLLSTMSGLRAVDGAGALIRDVLTFERQGMLRGTFEPGRSVLADERVRSAMIEAANAAPIDSLRWVRARRLLKEHPSLSEADRERVRIDVDAERRARESARSRGRQL